MDLSRHMRRGIDDLAKSLSRFYLKNAGGRRFLASFVSALARSANRRDEYERSGRHIPVFLIASIASQCNLRCAGCYARAEGLCSDAAESAQMGAEEWARVFREAHALGVSFILLAGGEPLLRRDVLEAAADIPDIAFPVFTNGTLIDEAYLDFFDAHRHLIPVLSMEGSAAETDRRRGAGVSAHIGRTVTAFRERGILFAASVTVTNQNLHGVTSEDYLSGLRRNGCGIVFLVEYVPAEKGTEQLLLSAEESEWLNARAQALRLAHRDMSIFSFPGDEKFTEGCLAAGRGFFHINPGGGAEPCPFSPFSAQNVRNSSLLEVLTSPFFEGVREISRHDTSHGGGGCTLFSHEQEVRRLLAGQAFAPGGSGESLRDERCRETELIS